MKKIISVLRATPGRYWTVTRCAPEGDMPEELYAWPVIGWLCYGTGLKDTRGFEAAHFLPITDGLLDLSEMGRIALRDDCVGTYKGTRDEALLLAHQRVTLLMDQGRPVPGDGDL